MSVDKRSWRRLIFDLKASVIPGIISQVAIVVIFATLVSWANVQGLPVAQESFSSIIPELVLGLLLVFRTDTAYTRFWEGSGIISDIIDLSRSLARSLWVYIDTDDEAAYQEKVAYTRLVGIFMAALKQHLRDEKVDSSMQALLTAEQVQELQQVNHMPIRVTQWLSEYLKKMHHHGKLTAVMFTELSRILDRLTLCMGSCERILTTPLPLAYAIHLKHLLFLYFLLVPFKLVGALGWGTPIAVAIIAFALLGIEEIGLEIENPFGYDPNDLPLDQQTQELWADIEEIMTEPQMKTELDLVLS